MRLDRTEDILLRCEVALGVLVCESVPGAFARFRAEAIVAWLDFEPVYSRATELYLQRVAEGGRWPTQGSWRGNSLCYAIT